MAFGSGGLRAFVGNSYLVEPSRKGQRVDLDHPDRQAEFKPQPGDIIIRKIPEPQTTQVLSVMGILRIYSDEYYFIYAEGEAHRVKFAFRNGDLILRFGRFTSKYYTWVYEEFASLYLFYSSGQERSESSPGSWYKVAQRQNMEPYIDDPNSQIPGYSRGLEREILDPETFEVDTGDYLIHQTPVQASDRPWGVSYELRVVGPHNDGVRPVIWSRGDVCVRVRMRTPPSDEALQFAGKLDYVMDYVDKVLDEFVPMYVYGYLCIGQQLVGFVDWNSDAKRYINTKPQAIWRYLSFDHHVFTNLKNRLQEDTKRKLFDCCPVRPGDIILNLDERINNLAPLASDNGYILIARDGPQALNRPEDMPGSMIVRVGYFLDPGADANIYIHRENEMDHFQPERDDFLTWAEIVTPQVYMRNPLTESGWFEAATITSSTLPERPLDLQIPQHPLVPRGIGLEHPPRIFDHINQRVDHPLEFCQRDLIFNKDPSPDHLAMFSKEMTAIWSWDSQTRVDFAVPGADNPFHTYMVLKQEGKDAVNLFFWSDNYQFRDGDHLIRHNIEEDQDGFPAKWVASVELYAYHKIPTRWKRDAEGFWVFRGRDQAVLPVRYFPLGHRRLLFGE